MENNKTQQIDKEEDIDLARVVKSCLRTLRREWKWFALSLVVCVAASYLYQKRQPEVFQRQSVVLIENAESGSPFSARRSSGTAMSSLLEMNGISVGDNLKNETFILTSKRLMKNVVDTLGLDVDYTTTWRLRPITLYKDTPVRVRFKDRAAKAASFSMELREDGTVMLHNFRVGPDRYAQTYEVQPGRTIATPAGVLTLERGETFNEFPRGQEVSVTHLPLMAAAALYSGKMSAAEYDKESSLIVLTCNDASAQRAEDVLDELYNAYMRDIVANKNRVAESTMRFIEDRSAIVGAELADAEGINPFFQMMDPNVRYVAVVLSVTAGIIASQALITGAFTMVSEATGLNWMPHLQVRYPARTRGQLYIPVVNVVLCVATLAVLLLFRDSEHISAAYGLALTITMITTTILLGIYLWHRSNKFGAVVFTIVFLAIQVLFFAASMANSVALLAASAAVFASLAASVASPAAPLNSSVAWVAVSAASVALVAAVSALLAAVLAASVALPASSAADWAGC